MQSDLSKIVNRSYVDVQYPLTNFGPEKVVTGRDARRDGECLETFCGIESIHSPVSSVKPVLEDLECLGWFIAHVLQLPRTLNQPRPVTDVWVASGILYRVNNWTVIRCV
jgi:hypothetical protein